MIQFTPKSAKPVAFGKATSGVGDCPEINSAPGRVILVSGPSGVGKGSVIKGIFADKNVQDQYTQVRSLKTRPPRPGEEGSPDSEFVSVDAFLQLKNENKLFQWALFDNNWYGSRATEILAKLQKGVNVLFELTAQDALKIKEKYPAKVTTIFIAPPAPEVETLRERLVGRNTNSADSIAERLQSALFELSLKGQFDKIIVNETGKLNEAIDKLKAIAMSSGNAIKFAGRSLFNKGNQAA